MAYVISNQNLLEMHGDFSWPLYLFAKKKCIEKENNVRLFENFRSIGQPWTIFVKWTISVGFLLPFTVDNQNNCWKCLLFLKLWTGWFLNCLKFLKTNWQVLSETKREKNCCIVDTQKPFLLSLLKRKVRKSEELDIKSSFKNSLCTSSATLIL